MRVASYDPAALESQIGPCGETTVNSANRALVQNWLVANGVPSARAKAMKLATLWKCYNRPRYLVAVLSHIQGSPVHESVALPDDDEAAQDLDEAKAIAEQEADLSDDLKAINTANAIKPPPTVTTPAVAAVPYPAAPDAASQLAALIQSLAAGAINEQRVIELIAEHAPERVVERIVLDRGFERVTLSNEIRHRAFPEILATVAANIPVLLVGPAGSGKTTIGHQIANALSLAFSHTGAVTSRYELSGFIDAQGRYQRTAFRDAYENGGIFLFDEIDASDAGALLWCNAAIANGVCAFPDGNIERHADFRLIAAANTLGLGADRIYVGRNQLDGATLDRFVPIEFDYDDDMERAAFGDTAWTARVQKIRGAVQSLRLRHVVSPRATDYGRRLLAAGLPQHRVEQMTVWKGLPPADVAKVEHAIAGGL